MLVTGVAWTAVPAQPARDGAPARRAAPRAAGAGFGPCKEEVQRVCPDVKPGEGRVVRCLEEKKADLSPACRDFLQQRRAEYRTARVACADDMKRLCAGIRPGQGRIAACLRRHEADLSPACKQEMGGP